MNKIDQKDIIFVGNSHELMTLFDKLKRPKRVLGCFCSQSSPIADLLPVLGGVEDVPVFLEAKPEVQRVYCCISTVDVLTVKEIQQKCKLRGVKFCAVLPVINELDDKFVPMQVGRQLLLTPRAESLSRILSLVSKRTFDMLVSLLLLLTVFPVVYLVMYVLAKKKHLGAVLASRRCCGPNGREFSMLMFQGADEEPIGLDALPQLMNVLVGTMSLVGPRPIPVLDDEEETAWAEGGSDSLQEEMEPEEESNCDTAFPVSGESVEVSDNTGLSFSDEKDGVEICVAEDEVSQSPSVAREPALRLERQYLKSGMVSFTLSKFVEDRDYLKDDMWYVEHWTLLMDCRVLLKRLIK